jgi:alpha-L-rhamnosidase
MKSNAILLLKAIFVFTFLESFMIAQQYNGKWIWQSADGPANTWICFRKTFTVSEKPGTAIAFIAVDSKYWLWVNNQQVVFEGGLKRGPTPEDTYVDTITLSEYLTSGNNTISMLVRYFGKQGYSHKSSGKGGLFFECAIDDTLIISDSTWKMNVHPAFEQSSSVYPDRKLPESNIRFNALKDTLGDWTSLDYNDTSWLQATEKGAPPDAPWNHLWIRPVPQWKNSGLVDYPDLSVDLPFTSATDTTIRCMLPYNAQFTPFLEIVSPAGQQIIIYSDISSRTSNSIVGEYITKPGTQQYESLGWMNGHFVYYVIPAGVTVKSLKYRETGYNTEFAGSFTCNDDFFNTLWKKAQRTLYVNMRDNYMDCPDRERAMWWGDAVNEIGQSFYALDRKSDLLARKSISNLVEWQKSDSVLFSPVPSGNWNSEYPLQMLASIGRYGFWNYFLYSGDTSAIINAYPHVKKYLGIWSLDEDGLAKHRNGMSFWGDWGKNIDTRILANCWYYMAVKTVRDMAILTGNAVDTAIFNPVIASLENNFNRVLWNNNEYRSPGYYTATDDRGNGLAVVAGLADSTKWPMIRQVLLNQHNASPYMEKYVLEALYIMGNDTDALNRMKRADRYGSMVADTLTTLYELFGNKGTYNHGWSGGPLTLLSQYCAGVAPETAGFESYHVYPEEGEVTNLKATVPSVKGDILVETAKDSAFYNLDLVSPINTVAKVGIPRLPFRGKTPASISINDEIAWEDGYYLENENFSFIGMTDKKIVFEVKPGTYHFSAVLKDTLVQSATQDDHQVISGCRLYPNPVDDFVAIHLSPKFTQGACLYFYNCLGKMVHSCRMNSYEEWIDISNLTAGIYIIRIIDNTLVDTIKCVKK